MCKFLLFFIITAALLLAGCANASNPVSTSMHDESMSPKEGELDSHMLWGLYDMVVSEDHSAINVLPRHSCAMHLNVRTFLEDGPCTDCLSISGVKVLPGWQMEVGITLRHPFAGQNIYTGFDVRGIAMFDGTRLWPASGLLMSDADIGDIELLNPDGYTRLFNAVEYAPGTGAGIIHEYSHGKLAPSGEPNATLNGYINYYTNEERRYFLPGQSVNHTYVIQAKAGGFKFGYAVDASWRMPLGTPPYNVPDDFPVSANCQEGYEFSIYYEPGMKADGSGASYLTVDVYDWQNPAGVVAVQAECPDIFSGIKNADFAEMGNGYARYIFGVVNSMGADEGEYEMLLWAEDVLDASDPKHLTAYTITRMTVEPEVVVPDPPELITVIKNIFHSPFCAKVDTQTDKCYVNSTQLAPVLDLSIRTIDAGEKVADFYFKADMGGWFGLNPAVRKLISPDFFTTTGHVDFLELDGGAAYHFYLPVDAMQGAAFLSDGEVFTSINRACAVDAITDRLIVWNYKNMNPLYSQISTADFPEVVDADYEGNRLFVYCLGHAGESVPVVNVFDMTDEVLITTLKPVHTGKPFWTEVDYDPDAHRLYAGAGVKPGFVEVWDTDTYEYIGAIETPLEEVHGIEHLNGYLYCTGGMADGGKLIMVDPKLMATLYTFDCGSDPVFLAANPNNKKIYVPDVGGQAVYVWQGY